MKAKDLQNIEIRKHFNMELINIIVYGDGPSGMRLEGGGHFPTYVSKLHKRGRAKSAGIRTGDEVVSINGFPCNTMDLQEAQDLVKNTPDIQLELLRRVGLNYQEETPSREGFDTDSSELHSPFMRVTRNLRQQISSPFRTTDQTSNTIIPIYVSNDGTGIISPNDDRSGQHWHREYRQSYSRSRASPKLSQSPTKRHITRAYIIPANNEFKPKEKLLFQSHIDPIEIKWNFPLNFKKTNHTSFDIPISSFNDSTDIHLQNVPKPAKCFQKMWQPSTPVKKSSLSSENSFHSPCEEVIIWSSKNLSSQEKHLKKTVPLGKPKTWQPQFQSNESVTSKPHSPTPPLSVKDVDPNASRVVVNEELIDAGLLTRGFVTAAGIPVETHLEPKKLYSDSSFYEDPCHKYPTIEEQIKMARKVANLLTSNTGRTGKGQKMFLKRQEMSSKWVTHLDPLVEASINEEKDRKNQSERNMAATGHLGEGPFDQVSRAKRASDLEKMRLKEEKSLHNVVPFDLCAQLAHELHQVKGKGGRLFAKIKEKAMEWVVSENDPKLTSGLRPFNQEPKCQKELLELMPLKPQHNFTPLVKTTDAFPSLLGLNREQEVNQISPLESGQPPQNKLKEMINHPKPVMTPWESVVETGNLDKAFEHLCNYEDLKGPGAQNTRQPGTKQYGYTSSVSPIDPRQFSTNAEMDNVTNKYSNGHFNLFSESRMSEARYKPVHFRPTMI